MPKPRGSLTDGDSGSSPEAWLPLRRRAMRDARRRDHTGRQDCERYSDCRSYGDCGAHAQPDPQAVQRGHGQMLARELAVLQGEASPSGEPSPGSSVVVATGWQRDGD